MATGGETEGEGEKRGRQEEGWEEAGEQGRKRRRMPLQGCRRIEEYDRLSQLGEGTYGSVYRAREKGTGNVYAVKRVKLEKEREGFPQTSLREISLLMSLSHPGIVNVREVCVGDTLDKVYVVMEYVEHEMKDLLAEMKSPFTAAEAKCLLRQLFSALAYLHANFVIHRDLKTSNLLYTNTGQLKLCDFGMARPFGSPLRPYTHLVVTLWYRPPELLLGQVTYSTAVDSWSLGCIMAELLARKPLFQGSGELDQLSKIFATVGSPSEEEWPALPHLPLYRRISNRHKACPGKLRHEFPSHQPVAGKPTLTEAGFSLLQGLLRLNPDSRLRPSEALHHDWFSEFPPPKKQELMPTFPAKTAQKPAKEQFDDPLEEQRRREQEFRQQHQQPGLFAYAD